MRQYDELLQNWKRFSEIIQASITLPDERAAKQVKHYCEQNIEILNTVLVSSITHLKSLQKANSLHEVICTQARLTDEIGKSLMKNAQNFFNASLGTASDYNEWLKAHCDLATD